MIAHRMSKIDSSGIRKVFDLAQKMQNPVNLSIGQPDFDVPEEIKNEAIKAIQDGTNKYTVTQGIPELRNGLLKRLQKEREVNAESIMITSGVSGALTLAFMVLINPEDEVLIPDPSFVSYKHLANFCGGKPVYIDTYPDFKLTAARIQSRITKKTTILVINSPANPTGAMCTSQELKEIAGLARKHNLLVISDEIYHDYDYNHEFDSIGRYYEKNVDSGRIFQILRHDRLANGLCGRACQYNQRDDQTATVHVCVRAFSSPACRGKIIRYKPEQLYCKLQQEKGLDV